MLSARFYSPGDLRVEATPDPVPQQGELVIGIHTALTCGTDLKCYRRGHPVLLAQTPSAFGHEGAGHVLAVGDGVTGFAVGDPVVAANSAPCGDCFYCQQAQYNLCDHLNFLNGTYAQQLLVPARIVAKNTYKLPPNFNVTKAAFAEPLAIALRGVALTGVKPGNHVAVLGLGCIGQLVVKVASLLGAHVTAIGRSPLKLAMAQQFGQAVASVDVSAQDLSDASVMKPFLAQHSPQGRGFDKVFEVVGQPHTWLQAMALVRKGGTVNCFGGCPAGSTVAFDTRRLHYEEITLLSLFHHTPSFFKQSVDWLVSGKLDPSPLLGSTRYPLERVVEALEAISRGEAIKLAIHPNEPLKP
jgi:L-iditol 2-dehydrogenase